MSAKAKTKEELVLYRKEREIEAELAAARREIPFFQPFINELFKTEFAVKPGIDEIRSWILMRSLDGFLKREALLLSPNLNSQEIDETDKLKQVSPRIKFKNYAELHRLYQELPEQEFPRIQINKYLLDSKNNLVLPQETINEIIDRHTFYAASAADKETYDEASKILDQARALFKKTGYALILPNAVAYPLDPTGDKWLIDPVNFNLQLKAKASK